MTTKRTGAAALLASVAGFTAAVGAQPADGDADAAAARAAEAPRSVASYSGNALDLGTTSITGNQELPKVLYIVPWKRSDLADLVGRPVNTLLDEVLAPIDPDVFERHLDYYGLLYAEGAAGRAAPGRAETEEE